MGCVNIWSWWAEDYCIKRKSDFFFLLGFADLLWLWRMVLPYNDTLNFEVRWSTISNLHFDNCLVTVIVPSKTTELYCTCLQVHKKIYGETLQQNQRVFLVGVTHLHRRGTPRRAVIHTYNCQTIEKIKAKISNWKLPQKQTIDLLGNSGSN